MENIMKVFPLEYLLPTIEKCYLCSSTLVTQPLIMVPT